MDRNLCLLLGYVLPKRALWFLLKRNEIQKPRPQCYTHSFLLEMDTRLLISQAFFFSLYFSKCGFHSIPCFDMKYFTVISFKNFLDLLSIVMKSFRRLLFNFQTCEDFGRVGVLFFVFVFLLLISSSIGLWLEKTLCVILVLWRVLRFAWTTK